jgi:molybdopterin-guanine dinucleotide biosynthesis protein A
LIGTILCGGENTRIPVLKGFLEVEGRTIIHRSIEVLGAVFEKVVLSTNMPERYFSFGLPMIGDISRERGPMTGIWSVLAATGEEAVFVVACDMPFVGGKLVSYMVREYRTGGEGYDAVVPVYGGRMQPLFGIYAKGVKDAMERLIVKGDRSLAGMLTGLRVKYIGEDEVRTLDPAGDSFVNINTIGEYEEVITRFQAPVAGW